MLDREDKPTGEYTYQGSVANKALELLGKEIGMIVERRNSSNVGYSMSDKPMSDEEWDATYCAGTPAEPPGRIS